MQFALGTPRGLATDGMLDRLPVSVLTSSVAIGGVSSREAPDLDARLVEAVLAGDRTAEERLYRRHAPSILRLATRLLRSNEDAMDVLISREALKDPERISHEEVRRRLGL